MTLFREFVGGNCSRKVYFTYTLVLYSLHIGFLLLSYFNYPTYPYMPTLPNTHYGGDGPIPPLGPYNPRYNQISHLGSPSLNPDGFIYFNITMILLAIGIIPIVRFLFSLHRAYMKITSALFMVVAVMEIISLILLPLYSVDNWIPHFRVASLIFSGFIAMVCILFYIWLMKIRRIHKRIQNTSNQNTPSEKKDKKFRLKARLLGTLYGYMLALCVLFLYYFNTLWEWIFYGSMLGYLLLEVVLVPDIRDAKQ